MTDILHCCTSGVAGSPKGDEDSDTDYFGDVETSPSASSEPEASDPEGGTSEMLYQGTM